MLKKWYKKLEVSVQYALFWRLDNARTYICLRRYCSCCDDTKMINCDDHVICPKKMTCVIFNLHLGCSRILILSCAQEFILMSCCNLYNIII